MTIALLVLALWAGWELRRETARREVHDAYCRGFTQGGEVKEATIIERLEAQRVALLHYWQRAIDAAVLDRDDHDRLAAEALLHEAGCRGETDERTP